MITEAKYMGRQADLTLGGRHAVHYTDRVSQNYIPRKCLILWLEVISLRPLRVLQILVG